MRFEIAQSLNGDKIMYIARDTNGIVRLREETEEKLQEAIKKYNEQLAEGAVAKTKEKEDVKTRSKQPKQPKQSNPPEGGAAFVPPSGTTNEPKKKLLRSDLKKKIEEKKSKSGKKSFWDKLK